MAASLAELEARVRALESQDLKTADPADPVQFVLPKSVTSALIAAGTISATELGTDSVGAAQIQANAVGNSEMADNAIGQAEILDNAVGEEELTGGVNDKLGITEASTTRRDRPLVNTSENTISTAYGDLTTVGPTTTLTVPASGLVMIWARVDIKANGGATGLVDLQEDGVSLTGGGALSIMSSVAAAFETNYTSYGRAFGVTNDRSYAGWVAFDTTAGSHTYKLVYKRTGGTSADFRNRRMWVVTLAA